MLQLELWHISHVQHGEVKLGFNGDIYPEAGASVVMTTKGDMVDYDTSRQRLGIGSTNQVLTVTAGLPAWEDAGHVTQSRALEVACSDETTPIVVADNLIKFRMPFGLTLNAGEDGVRASLSTAGGTSGTTTVDITMNGASIFTTNLLTIDDGDTTSVGATTEPNVTTTTLTDNAEIIVNCDVITGGGTEAGLKIQLIGTLI